ncbi:MAG: hypothetical protein R3F20_13570 [Planctomycetota bacterium]
MLELTNLGAAPAARAAAAASPEAAGVASVGSGPGFRPLEVGGSDARSFPDLLGAIDDAFRAQAGFEERMRTRLGDLDREGAALRTRGVKAGDEEFMDFQNKRLGALLEIQMEGHRTAFGVQIASKLIEHASSGVRTTLQTQA